jgi:hypothetical protein
MHGPETKIEMEVKIFSTNQIHEKQCIGLNGDCETILSLPLAPSVECSVFSSF